MSAVRPRAPRKRLNRAEREASLLAAAAEIVADAGVDALTMEGLADQAGINKALVYRFFANRDDVILGLWERETAAFDARARAALAEAEGLDQQLRTVLDLWLDDVEARGILPRLEAPGVGPPELEARRQRRTEAVVRFLADLIRAEHRMSRQQSLTAAAVLGSGAQGLAALRAHTGWSRRALADTFVRLCMGAIESLAR